MSGKTKKRVFVGRIVERSRTNPFENNPTNTIPTIYQLLVIFNKQTDKRKDKEVEKETKKKFENETVLLGSIGSSGLCQTPSSYTRSTIIITK